MWYMCITWTLMNNCTVSRSQFLDIYVTVTILRQSQIGWLETYSMEEFSLMNTDLPVFFVPSEVNRHKKPSECHCRIPLPTISDLNCVARTVVAIWTFDQYSRGSYFVILTIMACKTPLHYHMFAFHIFAFIIYCISHVVVCSTTHAFEIALIIACYCHNRCC